MEQSLASLLSTDESPASYVQAARAIDALPLERRLEVAVLSTFTFNTLVPFLSVELARHGCVSRVHLAPFGQIEQSIHDPESPIRSANVVVVAVRVEDTERALAERFVSLSTDAIEQQVARIASRIEQITRSIREVSQATIVVWNQSPPASLSAGLADPALEPSQTATFTELNRRIAKAVGKTASAVVFDAARAAVEVGLDNWQDLKLAHLGRIPFSTRAQLHIGRKLARTIAATRRAAAKCLVLDLDNTLWGGVIGEDGLGGIKLGEDFPGSAFKAFQRRVLALRDRGILLAIASKNNEADVREVFERHADMLLKWDDFAARQIHWNDKASSLRAIAEELSIGRDALVFFDDNPIEREWVKGQLPEVVVVDVPKDPLRYVAALDGVAQFDQLALTSEDRQRATLYQHETARKDLETSAGSLDDFLAALEIKAKIGVVDDETRARVVQLIGKTNQFNTTTRRHTAADLAEIERAGGLAVWMRVEDRFGDQGLVGVAIASKRGDDEFVVDSFLMSCRVLGRRVEHALLASLARRVSERGGKVLLGEFIPSAKNKPAADFFANAAFTALDPPRWWKRDLAADPIAYPNLVHIEET